MGIASIRNWGSVEVVGLCGHSREVFLNPDIDEAARDRLIEKYKGKHCRECAAKQENARRESEGGAAEIRRAERAVRHAANLAAQARDKAEAVAKKAAGREKWLDKHYAWLGPRGTAALVSALNGRSFYAFVARAIGAAEALPRERGTEIDVDFDPDGDRWYARVSTKEGSAVGYSETIHEAINRALLNYRDVFGEPAAPTRVAAPAPPR